MSIHHTRLAASENDNWLVRERRLKLSLGPQRLVDLRGVAIVGSSRFGPRFKHSAPLLSDSVPQTSPRAASPVVCCFWCHETTRRTWQPPKIINGIIPHVRFLTRICSNRTPASISGRHHRMPPNVTCLNKILEGRTWAQAWSGGPSMAPLRGSFSATPSSPCCYVLKAPPLRCMAGTGTSLRPLRPVVSPDHIGSVGLGKTS